MLLASIKTGVLKPNSAMLRAICEICLGLWVRAFRGLDLRLAIDTCYICSVNNRKHSPVSWGIFIVSHLRRYASE
jgi:hypothetical protein